MSSIGMYGTEETLLVIIVDLLPRTVVSILDQLKIFMEAHVLLRPFNKILLVTTCGEESRFLYPTSGDKLKRTYGKGDMVEAIMNLKDHILRTNCKKNGSLGAALTLGICFVNRWLSKKAKNESMHRSPKMVGMPAYWYWRRPWKKTISSLIQKQRIIEWLWTAFSAEKMNVLIDCFDVTPWSPTLSLSQMSKMQQVCYISKGLHWSSAMDKMEKKEFGQDEKKEVGQDKNDYFLPTLIFYFLPGRESRRGLRQPPCVCWLKRLLFWNGCKRWEGLLCSICLSVTSTKRKSCITCLDIFKRFLVFEATKKAKRNVMHDDFFPLFIYIVLLSVEIVATHNNDKKYIIINNTTTIIINNNNN